MGAAPRRRSWRGGCSSRLLIYAGGRSDEDRLPLHLYVHRVLSASGEQTRRMAQFVLGHLEVVAADKWDKEGLDVVPPLLLTPPPPSPPLPPGGQTAVQSAVPADFGADSKVKGRQTAMAVNVFVFYCPLPPAFP